MISPKLVAKGITEKDLELRDQILSGTKDKKFQYKNSCYEVMVHKLCQEKCFFCSQDHKSRTTDIKPNDNDIYKRILYGAKKGYGMLGFTGGEPLIHKNILNYIRFGKKAGFRLIRVQTNGVMLGVPGFADSCVEAGATLFKFSIHHFKPEVHDYLVQLPGAFEKVELGIKRLRELGARIGINIVLTKQNYKDLPDFLMYFLDKGVTSFVIIYPLYENSMKDESSTVGFRFSDTIPYLVKSLQIFDRLSIKRPLVLNLPMCLLPGYESAIIQTFNGTAVLNLDGSKTNIDDNKAGGKRRVAICSECEHNKICFGVDERYLEKWGNSEFSQKQPQLDFQFDFESLELKKYFTEDELCFMEILRIQEKVTIDDIVRIKDGIQICQDCDSINKIISTGDILAQKSLIMKKFIRGKVVYQKFPSGLS